MNTVLEFLEANWQRLHLEPYGLEAGRMSCIILTPRFRASRQVVVLVLPRHQPQAALVAKLPRLPETRASLAMEAANLQAVHTLRPGGFDSIPRLVTFEDFHGYPILLETALVGRPLDPISLRRDLAGGCTAVATWLMELHAQPPPLRAEPDAGWFERLIERPLRRFMQALSVSAAEATLMDRMWQTIEPLRRAKLPLVVEHGDLSHPNLLRLERGGVGVVDWELAEPHGLPACDLFFFLTYAAFALRRARSNPAYQSAFQAAFFGRSAWTRRYVAAYAERLGLEASWLTPLFTACWSRYLAGLAFRLNEAESVPGVLSKQETALSPETVGWLRTNRYYTLWRYVLTHQDELDWGDLSNTPPGPA